MSKIDILSLGYGNVGREAASPGRLEKLAKQFGPIGIHLVMRSSGLYELRPGTNEPRKIPDDELRNFVPQLAFVATPSSQGEITLDAIRPLLENGETVVVTAEKGAITYAWDELAPYIDATLGISATVGGGTQLLRAAHDQADGGPISRIDLVANGTLGVIMEEFKKGTVPPTVAELVTKMGYAEPGATNILDIISGELGDVAKKAQIFYNYALGGKESIDSSALAIPVITPADLHRLRGSDADRRMVITFARTSEYPELADPNQDRIGLTTTELPSGWTVAMGFMKPNADPVLNHRLKLPGVDAGYVMRAGGDGSDGVYTHSGPGAGPKPTARAMHADAARLLSNR